MAAMARSTSGPPLSDGAADAAVAAGEPPPMLGGSGVAAVAGAGSCGGGALPPHAERTRQRAVEPIASAVFIRVSPAWRGLRARAEDAPVLLVCGDRGRFSSHRSPS